MVEVAKNITEQSDRGLRLSASITSDLNKASISTRVKGQNEFTLVDTLFQPHAYGPPLSEEELKVIREKTPECIVNIPNLQEKIPTLAEYAQEKSIESTKQALDISKQYMDTQIKPILKALSDAIKTVYKKHVSIKLASTSPDALSEFKFYRRDGTVLATNIGHLLSIYSDIDNYGHEQAGLITAVAREKGVAAMVSSSRMRGRFKCCPTKVLSLTAPYGVSAFFDGGGPDFDPRVTSDTMHGVRFRRIQIHCTLAGLDGIKAENDISQERACELIREISFQTIGVRKDEIQPRFEKYRFSSRDTKFFITGKEILEIARNGSLLKSTQSVPIEDVRNAISAESVEILYGKERILFPELSRIFVRRPDWPNIELAQVQELAKEHPEQVLNIPSAFPGIGTIREFLLRKESLREIKSLEESWEEFCDTRYDVLASAVMKCIAGVINKNKLNKNTLATTSEELDKIKFYTSDGVCIAPNFGYMLTLFASCLKFYHHQLDVARGLAGNSKSLDNLPVSYRWQEITNIHALQDCAEMVLMPSEIKGEPLLNKFMGPRHDIALCTLGSLKGIKSVTQFTPEICRKLTLELKAQLTGSSNGPSVRGLKLRVVSSPDGKFFCKVRDFLVDNTSETEVKGVASQSFNLETPQSLALSRVLGRGRKLSQEEENDPKIFKVDFEYLNKLPTAEAFVAARKPPNSREECIEIKNYYIASVKQLYNLVQILGSICKAYSLDASEISTAPKKLAGIKIVNKDGRVLAESVGHLISVYMALRDYVSNQSCYVNSLGFGKVTPRSKAGYPNEVMRDAFHASKLSTCNNNSCSSYTLSSFPVKQEKLELLSKDTIIELTEEACWQLYGVDSSILENKSFKAHFEKISFYNLNNMFVCGGHGLYRAFNIAKGASDNRAVIHTFGPIGSVSAEDIAKLSNETPFTLAKERLTGNGRKVKPEEIKAYNCHYYDVSKNSLLESADGFLSEIEPPKSIDEAKRLFQIYCELNITRAEVRLCELVNSILYTSGVTQSAIGTNLSASRASIVFGSNGAIVAENFGHLLTLGAELTRFKYEQAAKFNALGLGEVLACPSYEYGAMNFLHDSLHNDAKKRSVERKYLEPNGQPAVDYTLTTFPRPFSSLRKCRIKDLIAVKHEACMQMFGVGEEILKIPHFRERFEKKVFSANGGKPLFRGSELISILSFKETGQESQVNNSSRPVPIREIPALLPRNLAEASSMFPSFRYFNEVEIRSQEDTYKSLDEVFSKDNSTQDRIATFNSSDDVNKIRAALRDTVKEAISRNGITLEELSTAPIKLKRAEFKDSSGRVVAKSFCQLIVMACEIERLIRIRRCEFAQAVSERDLMHRWSLDKSPREWLIENAEYILPKEVIPTDRVEISRIINRNFIHKGSGHIADCVIDDRSQQSNKASLAVDLAQVTAAISGYDDWRDIDLCQVKTMTFLEVQNDKIHYGDEIVRNIAKTDLWSTVEGDRGLVSEAPERERANIRSSSLTKQQINAIIGVDLDGINQSFPSFRWVRRIFVDPDFGKHDESVKIKLESLDNVKHIESACEYENRAKGNPDWFYYFNNLELVRTSLRSAVRQIIQNEKVYPANLSTAPRLLNDLYFADSRGARVATSFCHLIVMCCEVERFIRLQKAYVHGTLTGNDYRYRWTLDKTPREWLLGNLDYLYANMDVPQTKEEIYKAVSKNFEIGPEKELVDCVVKDEKSSHQKIDTKDQAYSALGEALFEVTGFDGWTIPELCQIKPLKFAFQYGSSALVGERLFNRLKYHDQGIVAEVNEAPGRDYSSKTVHALKEEKTPEEIRRDLYREIFDDLEVPISAVFLARCALGDARETRKSFRSFDELIIRARDGQKEREKKSLHSPIETFRDFVVTHHRPEKEVDLSSVGKARLTEFLKQLCYRAYGADYSKMLAELHECRSKLNLSKPAEKTVNEILDAIAPILEKRFAQVREFNNPTTIRFTPFGYQREAVIGALSEDRPLVVSGPGTGKTEMAALYAEACQHNGALWCTRASVRPDAARRLREDLLSIDRKVVELTPDHVRLPADELSALLKDAFYVVISYDTLRGIHPINGAKRIERIRQPNGVIELQSTVGHAANFKVIQEWAASRTKILDEAHVLDNYNSRRSKTLQDIATVSTAIFTATPFQHRPERLATLLHLALPHIYSDPVSLGARFKDDHRYMRALLHQHATLISIDDITMPFESFSVVCAEEQLKSGLPRIPKQEVLVKNYKLSLAESRLYADIATNYDLLAQKTGWKKGTLGQLTTLRRLVVNPQKLGLQEPHSMLAAIKEIAIPALERGEKVLITGRSLAALDFVAKDTELQAFGLELLNGRVSPEDRVKAVNRHENDDDLKVIVGQSGSVGTGLNFRSTTHLICIDREPLIADQVQLLARHRRILTLENVRFAKEIAFVHLLEPELNSTVLREIKEPKRVEYLKRGTIYSEWLRRDLEKMREYVGFTSKSGKGRVDQISSIKQMVANLAEEAHKLDAERAQYQLLSDADLGEHFHRYRTPVKNIWRTYDQGGFVASNLKLLEAKQSDLVVDWLPGPEAIELSGFLELGIKPKNIRGYEADQTPAIQKVCSEKLTKAGCQYHGTKIEQVIHAHKKAANIIALDSHGYITSGLFDMFTELDVNRPVMILKNALCQRESEAAKKLLQVVGNNRRRLDMAMLKLTGSKLGSRLGIENCVEVLDASERIDAVASMLGTKICGKLGGDKGIWGEMLADLARGSPHITSLKQLRYKTPNGRPFLSTFAVIKPWDLPRSLKVAAEELREYLTAVAMVDHYSNIQLVQEKGAIRLIGLSGEKQLVVSLSNLRAIYKYYKEVTPKRCRESFVMSRPLEQLEVS